jgi:ABC-type nitrate/sulfonate/bicarbonate transport system permease component
MGAGRGRVFRRVVLPAALPFVFAGLRVALALSFIVMFATEMINSTSGLGYLIRAAESGLRFDLMYVSLVAIGLLGYAGDRGLRFARARALAWQPEAA